MITVHVRNGPYPNLPGPSIAHRRAMADPGASTARADPLGLEAVRPVRVERTPKTKPSRY
jgi:hypothetical protein